MKKLFSVLAIIFALSSCTIEKQEVIEITGITISEKSISIFENEEKTLTAEVTPSNAADKTVTWSSDNEAVATVSNGRVKGVREGRAVITAKAGNFTASCSVTVLKSVLIVTGDACDVTSNSARVTMNVNLSLAGNYSSYNAGIVFGTGSNLSRLSDTVYEIARDKNGNPDTSGSYEFELAGLMANTTYRYMAFAEFDGKEECGEVKSFTTSSINLSTDKMVDLGLSVKWAGWNVGASRPEEFGDYFSWGETKPKDSYWQDDYKYGVVNKYGTDDVIYKYNVREEYGDVDGRTRLSATDDAAYVNWGSDWRMPTDEEKTELLANTVHTEYVLNDVPGWLFTSKINGVSIFFPATGVKEQLNTSFVGEETIFWTSTLRSNDPRMAYVACNWIENSELLHEAGFEMDPTAESFHLSKWRYFGLPVRAVSGSPIPDDSYTLVTHPAEDITPFSVKVKVSITPAANAAEFGLLYTNWDDTPLLPGQAYSAAADAGGVVLVQGLLADRTYRACAYAIVDGVKYYGNEIEFHTGEMITLEALGVEEVTSGSAKMNGKVGDIESIRAKGVDIQCGIAYDKTDYGYSSLTGESSHLTLVPDEDGRISGTAVGLSSHTEYYYRAYLKVGDSYYFSSNYTKFTTSYPSLDKWVDLGLSVMWASWDIGAESGADKTGDVFAWGETQAKEYYESANYKWRDGNNKMTKYVTDPRYGTVDNLTVLEACDDAASAAWGMQGARIPTKEEFDELLTECTITKEFYMSNERVKFTGPNGNFIYLNNGTEYWTASLDEEDNTNAHHVYVANPKEYIRKETGARWVGLFNHIYVRAVKPVEEVIN